MSGRGTVTFITGGARSGKSRYALDLAASRYSRRAFVATAEPIDDEMRKRIRQHREERGEHYTNLEEPIELAAALRRLPSDTEVAVVDCLTIWLNNLIYRQGAGSISGDLDLSELAEVGALLGTLDSPPCELVLVSNEIGLGVIPANPLARSFVDLLGRLNQEVAARADHVVLLVSGIPLAVKGGLE